MTSSLSRQHIGIYPGTFDPVTYGHIDIIRRSAPLFDKLIIGVAGNPKKRPMFSLSERVQLIQEELSALSPNFSKSVDVKSFSGLLINFARDEGARGVVRGLRAASDFEFEFQMAGMNRHLCAEIETLFLMASDRYQFVSSRFIKEIACLGGDVSAFVSPRIAQEMLSRCSKV